MVMFQPDKCLLPVLDSAATADPFMINRNNTHSEPSWHSQHHLWLLCWNSIYMRPKWGQNLNILIWINSSPFSRFKKPRPASVCDCVASPHPPPIINPSHSALFSTPSVWVMTSTIMAGRTGHAGSGFLKTPAIMFHSGTADADHTAIVKTWAVQIPPTPPLYRCYYYYFKIHTNPGVL